MDQIPPNGIKVYVEGITKSPVPRDAFVLIKYTPDADQPFNVAHAIYDIVPVTVKRWDWPKVEINFKAFIPNTIHAASPDAPWFPSPWILKPGEQFKTDDRGFFVANGTARQYSFATISGDGKVPVANSDVAYSHMRYPYEPNAVATVLHNAISQPDFLYAAGFYLYFAKKTTLAKETHMYPDHNAAGVKLTFGTSGRYAYADHALAPPLDYEITYVITRTALDKIEVKLTGKHDRFPAYEGFVMINGQMLQVYSYDPAAHGEMGPTVPNLTLRAAPINELKEQQISPP